jgi:hypothetical protein
MPVQVPPQTKENGPQSTLANQISHQKMEQKVTYDHVFIIFRNFYISVNFMSFGVPMVFFSGQFEEVSVPFKNYPFIRQKSKAV